MYIVTMLASVSFADDITPKESRSFLGHALVSTEQQRYLRREGKYCQVMLNHSRIWNFWRTPKCLADFGPNQKKPKKKPQTKHG
jgi:hypothetical protein